MVTLIVVLLGAVALLRIQIDLLPDIELPTLSVATSWEGASPEVMERRVTQIIEEIVATVPGVVELRSRSAQGSSSVRVTFGFGRDIDTAALDVRSKLEDELSELPEEIDRPQIRKFDIGSFPVVLLGVSSRMDPVELTTLVERQLRPRFSRLPNIAQVDLWGGFEREIRVELDLERLKALELPLERVLTAIRDANLDLPAGRIESGRFEITLRAPAELASVDMLREVRIEAGGRGVRLDDLAEVKDTYKRLTRIIRVNGAPGIRLAIRKQADANTVEVARRILAEVEAINAELPQIEVVPVVNQGSFIERSIANVARSVTYGGGLAVLVLLFFLLSLRSTLVVALAIPVSIVATFALMFFSGLTVNLTTLGGLALAVGMMVDSSIVVLENVFRRRDELEEPGARAAVEGAREVGPAILASTLTTSVVFLPLAFARGVSGLLFRDLAYVIVFGLAVALAVSVSLLPMLASVILPDRSRTAGRFEAWAEAARRRSERLLERYLRLLGAALAHPKATLLVAAALLGASLLLVPAIGTELLPPSDEGRVSVRGELEIGTRLGLVKEATLRMESIVRPAVPEALAFVTTAGASGRRPQDGAEGEVDLSLVPAADRARSNQEIARDLRRRLEGQIPGMKIRVRAPQGSFLLRRLLRTEDGLTIEVRGFELEALDALAAEVAEAVGEVPGISDVDVGRREGVPQAVVQMDRAKLADLGLSPRDVARTLEAAVAGRQAGEFRERGTSHRIFVQLADVRSLELDDILGLPLTVRDDRTISLRSVVEATPGTGPVVIARKDQERIVSVYANVAGRDLGSVAEDVRARLREVPVPDGLDVRLSGAFEEQQAAFRELLLSLVLALVLVYMVLASQYESLASPFVVMLSVPLGAIGVLLALFLTGSTLNVQSYIGCIMLGGILVNNAILLVDQAGTLVREGEPARRAAVEAGRRRLRPILMTTLTTVLGLLPLALGIGEGADAQAPLARAVIGGLLGSTPVTLIVVPVAFTLLVRGRKGRARS
jgi:HAE1 family hydrophobic/amphiphilic exporter-1